MLVYDVKKGRWRNVDITKVIKPQHIEDEKPKPKAKVKKESKTKK